MKSLCFAFLLLPAVSAAGQQAPPKGELARKVSWTMSRVGTGHALTPEEIASEQAAEGPPKEDEVREALPLLEKALTDHDPMVRAYGLAMLTGLEQRDKPIRPRAAEGSPEVSPGLPIDPIRDGQEAAPVDPATFSGFSLQIIAVLREAVPKIAILLTDDTSGNRLAAAALLDGFFRQPPPAATASLLAFLRRDDAIGAVGQAVVGDLLDYGPVAEDSATGLARYLRRRDQTPESRTELVDLVAGSPNQSQAVNAALVTYLNGDDGSLRARLILSLPQLDLAPDLFTDARTRVAGWAGGGQDSLQVTTAARSIATCWTAPRMKTPCPAYENDATPAPQAP